MHDSKDTWPKSAWVPNPLAIKEFINNHPHFQKCYTGFHIKGRLITPKIKDANSKCFISRQHYCNHAYFVISESGLHYRCNNSECKRKEIIYPFSTTTDFKDLPVRNIVKSTKSNELNLHGENAIKYAKIQFQEGHVANNIEKYKEKYLSQFNVKYEKKPKLESIKNIELYSTLVYLIRAATKSGKTSKLLMLFQNLKLFESDDQEIDTMTLDDDKPNKKKILVIISSKRTYTKHITSEAAKYGINLESYEQIDGPIDLMKHNNLVIQVDSLHRIKEFADPETSEVTLVLDEMESILSQFSSKTCTFRYKCWELALNPLVTNAKNVIIMDAYLSERSFRVTNEFLTKREELMKRSLKENFQPDTVLLDYYYEGNYKDYKYIFSFSEIKWWEKFKSQVSIFEIEWKIITIKKTSNEPFPTKKTRPTHKIHTKQVEKTRRLYKIY